jgi:predicted phage terminase large subunit-like protein
MGHDPEGHWTVLMVPMHYDPERHCRTSIGWEDPRGLDDDTRLPLRGVGQKPPFWCDELGARNGELFWPERFPAWTVEREMETMGPYAVASQFEQSPTPRGGGLIRQEDWQLWERPRFPTFDFIVVSFDGAYTEKTMNDPSAATVWGRFMLPEDRRPHFMLIHAWQKRLPMNDVVEQLARTCLGDYVSDVREPMADETRRSPTADALLIESKGPGISVGQEITRLYGRRKWRTFLITPKGDKTARLLSVQHLFAAGQIWAPDKDWAQTVIDEVCSFPKAAHDDLTDCTSQALRWLRDVNLVMTAEEADEDWTERNRYRKPRAKLYPGT